MQVLLNRAVSSDLQLGVCDRLALACDTQQLGQSIKTDLPELGGEREIASVSLERVHPRNDGSFILSYDVTFAASTAAENHRLFAVLPVTAPHDDYRNTLESLTKRRRRQLSKRRIDQSVGYLPSIGMILRFAGLDEKIDGLRYWRKPELLDEIPGIDNWLHSGDQPTVELLAHRLNRRAVLHVQSAVDDAQALILKLYKNGSTRPQRAHDVMHFLRKTSFAPGSRVSVPDSLQVLDGCAGLAMERVAGTPIDQLDGSQHCSAMRLAGEALGRLHRLPLQLPVCFDRNSEIDLLGRWVSLASEVWPQFRKPFEDRLKDVTQRLTRTGSGDHVLVHRDYHEGQIVVAGDAGSLIDFDTLSNGDAAIDLGNFVAHLQFRQLQKGCDTGSSISEFLSHYEQSAERPVSDHMDAYRASTMLRLASIYSFSSYWKHLTPDLLDMAT